MTFTETFGGFVCEGDAIHCEKAGITSPRASSAMIAPTRRTSARTDSGPRSTRMRPASSDPERTFASASTTLKRAPNTSWGRGARTTGSTAASSCQ